MTLPPDPSVLRVRCEFCGTEQPVPDHERRSQMLRERQRAEQEAERHRASMQAERARHEEERRDRRSQRRFWAWHRLWIFLVVLIGPGIAFTTAFDLRGRLFGSTGEDRVSMIVAQLQAAGCAPLVAPTIEYSNDETIAQMVLLQPGACVHVLASGGAGHDDMELKLFSPTNQEVASAPRSMDARVRYCAQAPGLYRYQVDPGLLDKGRLTHAALTCPPHVP